MMYRCLGITDFFLYNENISVHNVNDVKGVYIWIFVVLCFEWVVKQFDTKVCAFRPIDLIILVNTRFIFAFSSSAFHCLHSNLCV